MNLMVEIRRREMKCGDEDNYFESSINPSAFELPLAFQLGDGHGESLVEQFLGLFDFG